MKPSNEIGSLLSPTSWNVNTGPDAKLYYAHTGETMSTSSRQGQGLQDFFLGVGVVNRYFLTSKEGAHVSKATKNLFWGKPG